MWVNRNWRAGSGGGLTDLTTEDRNGERQMRCDWAMGWGDDIKSM